MVKYHHKLFCVSQFTERGNESAEYIYHVPRNMPVNKEVAHHISTLWKEQAIQKIFDERAKFDGINDSLKYFCDNIDRIASDTYMPTEMVCYFSFWRFADM